MIEVTLEEYQKSLRDQGADSALDWVVVCPLCKTMQTARELIEAGAGKSFDDVEGYLGFSCIGRWKGAKSPRKEPDGSPCNWSLGGLFQAHEMVVVTPDGGKFPRFRAATPEEAKKHMEKLSNPTNMS